MSNVIVLRPVAPKPVLNIDVSNPFRDVEDILDRAAELGKELPYATICYIGGLDFETQPTEKISFSKVSCQELDYFGRLTQAQTGTLAEAHGLGGLHPLTYLLILLHFPDGLLDDIEGRYLPDLAEHKGDFILKRYGNKILHCPLPRDANKLKYLARLPE